MKNKIISISIIFIFLFTALISVDAAAPSPRVNLNDYEITASDKNAVYLSGTVTICAGQNIGLFDSTGKIPYNYVTVSNTNSQGSFKIQVPSIYLKEGTNTFKIISLPVRGVLNASMPKTVTVTINTPASKQDQIITANNLTLKVKEKKNLNAKVNSGLPLTYVSTDPNVATVAADGTVYGNNVGSTSITITQAGNDKYNPASKHITITVSDAASSTTKNTYTIIYNANGGSGKVYSQKVEVGKSATLLPNKFTKTGYQFVGWTDASGRQIMSGTDVTKFKNVDMKHFQLGKVKYKNKASIKNLTGKNKQIVLYAVWKGNGPQAAVDWAKLIAADNNFCYNTTFKGPWGCYFCGDNRNWHSKKHYVCMTLVNAAYAHGANHSAFWSKNKTCNTTYIDGGARLSKIRKCKALKEVGKPKMSSLKPGDVFVWNTVHVAMYVGKSGGKYYYVEATRGSKPYTSSSHRKSQIRVKELKSGTYKKISSVFRTK